MKTRTGKCTLLAVMASLTLGFGTASAAEITESVSFTINAPFGTNLPPQTVNVSTPQFDPALGTFQSGMTTVTGTINLGLEFFNTGAGGPYDVLVDDTLSLGGIPGRFVEELTGTVPANQTAFITPGMTFPFGPVDRGDPAAQVVGTGMWNQVFSLPSPSLTLKQSPSSPLPGILIAGTSLTTYAYTPVITPVPEPRFTGVLVVVLGIGFVAANRRRRLAGPSKGRNGRRSSPDHA
jgi:hypothetical protein